MATATQEVVGWLGGEGKFTVLATTLHTGKFEDHGAAAFTAQFFVPFMLIMVGNFCSMIMGAVKEKNERQLVNMLKRMGYREIVDVYEEFIL